MTRSPLLCLALGSSALLAGCGDTPLVRVSDPFAAIVPQTADVAVGGRHDLTYFAVGECHQTIDLTNLLVATALTGFFVANGRIDAALALPEQLPETITIGTECDPIDYEVDALELDGAAFVLDDETDVAATLLAESEGTTTVRASFHVSDGTQLEAESTFRAHVPDRVEMSLACDLPYFGEYAGLVGEGAVAQGSVPAASTIPLGFGLFAGDVALSGYDYFPVDTGALRQLDEYDGGFDFETPGAPGPVRLTSSIDPDFALELEVYDATTIDEVRVVKAQTESVWSSTPFFRVATFPLIDGQLPCINRVERTLTVETPDVCQFATDGDPLTRVASGSVDSILPLAPGLCRLRADVVGGTATGTLEVEIGRPWEPVETGSPGFQPWALWGSGPTDIVVVGNVADQGVAGAAILRYDGVRWELTEPGPTGRLYAVWGSGPDDVLAVGDAGLVLAWDGEAWTQMDAGTTAQLYAVHGLAADEVYVMGEGGTFLRREGDGWTPIQTDVQDSFIGAWGPGPGSLYVVAATGSLYHFDGLAWTTVPLVTIDGRTDAPLALAVWGSGPSDVWASGNLYAFHFDGLEWTEVGAFFTTSAIWASGPADVVMVGGQRSLRYDGESWVEIPLAGAAALDRVWGSGPDDVYAVDREDGLFHLAR